jgi:light-regulated signal transduction histidine kinase (bacteriophytochrome)
MGPNALKILKRDAAGRVSYRAEQREAILDELECSGLGLHIAQWIVQRHACDIAVATGPDGLSRATGRLPQEE